MQKLYLACYFNEEEGENDVEVLAIDDQEDATVAFKKYFLEVYDYEIEAEHIIGIYPVEEVFDARSGKYKVQIEKVSDHDDIQE